MSESSIPTHLGLIIDGNRRWARAHNLPTLEGHKKGYDNLKTIAQAAFESGVKYVSAFVFSAENWNRDKEETSYLMRLALKIAEQDSKELIKKNIKIIVLGREDRAPKSVIRAFRKVEEESQNNTGGTLALCFNYSGRNEIADAFKKMVSSGINESDIDQHVVAKHLYHPELPEIDLLVRSSGELRISDFMLWRAAYAELLFVDKHWPDFTTEDLKAALNEYSRRNRRFGGN